MLAGKVSALILATAFVAQTASAQRFGHAPPMGDNSRLMVQESNGANANYFNQGVQALQSKNFQVAEGIFEEVLKKNPTHPEGNLMMGTTKMSLGKWEDARKYLEIAVRKNAKSPDPKSRLAVTLIRLGDMEGAMKQRADLEKMSQDCKGKCRNAEWIAAALAMVDNAMPPKQP